MNTLAERVERLAGYLGERGYLHSAEWHAALRAVPRHLFVPVRAWVSPDTPDRRPYAIDRESDPDAWWDAVYSDSVIVTQIDDGKGDPARGKGVWTSSISAPGIVFAFLERLDVLDHHRVLEIGTGSGWTAALLAHRVGAGNVTSIEIDPALAAWAQANLEEAGVRPRLIVGDGAAGHPGAAPYDRVHVACGVRDVPAAWIEQSRPGGVIMLPWMPGFSGGYQARLTVVGDGTAVGRFTGNAGYMMMRSQRLPEPHDDSDDARGTTTRLDPRGVVRDSRATAAIAARLPDVVAGGGETDEGAFELRLRERDGPSWATVAFVPGRTDFDVRQYGARGLWDEVVAAYEWWIRIGSPGLDRLGMTVAGDGQSIWLDDPGDPLGRVR
jgi:protein-L-isoaspartate O-methyltransferase